MKVLLYAGFIAVYLLYLIGTFKVMGKMVKDVKKINFLKEVFITIVTTTLLFSFMFIIGRFFNLKLLLITIAALVLGAILSYAIWALIGSPRIPFRAIGGWAGANIGVEYSTTVKVFQLLALIIIVIYPIAIGIVFFDSSYSPELTRILAFKFTVILALSNYLISTPLNFGILTAGYIDEDTRARYLIGMFTSIISLAVYISILFWLYNIDKEGVALFNIGDINLVYSPLITSFLMAFLLLFMVLPYAIGYNKSKRLSQDYFSSKKRLLKKINDGFELASIDKIKNAIEENRTIIFERFEKLEAQNIGVTLGMELDNVEKVKTPDEMLLFEWYNEAKAYDKRFVFYNWLDDIYQKLDTFEAELNEDDTVKVQEGIVKKFTTYFSSKYKSLVEEAKGGKSNHKLWIALMAILSPVLSALISEIGNFIITFFKGLN